MRVQPGVLPSSSCEDEISIPMANAVWVPLSRWGGGFAMAETNRSRSKLNLGRPRGARCVLLSRVRFQPYHVTQYVHARFWILASCSYG